MKKNGGGMALTDENNLPGTLSTDTLQFFSLCDILSLQNGKNYH
jgi:hypothetical protein